MPANPLSFNPVGAAVQLGGGLIQTAVGLINSGKAKREAKELSKTRPVREISPLAQQDLDLSESELAGGGLSATAENAYNSLNNKQFSSSLSAILKGGGSVNNVADVFGGNEEGRSRLALLSDQMRMSKIQNLVRSRGQMMDEQEKNFAFNKWMPFADKSQANAQARQNAENMIWGGLGTAGAGAMNMAAGYNDANKWNQYLNPPQQQQQTPGLNQSAQFNFNPQQQNFARQQQQMPQVQEIDFGLPPYMDSPDYLTGGHNMF